MSLPTKYYPYVFIAILCIVIAFFRASVLTEFPWYVHVFGFFGQFIVMSLVWQVIRLINRKLEKRFAIDEQPVAQISLQVIITLVLLSPVIFTTYFFARPYLPSYISEKFVILLLVLFVMILMLMTFGYYAYDLFTKYKAASEEKANLRLEAAQLEKEKSMMQYHHLKNQVNPHFLFNTFTSLDGLIQSNPDLASEFVRHLSKVYRYVLEHKENEVVSLEEEINFIKHYITLLEIRYKGAIVIEMDVSDEAKEKGIVMVTLQMLIDNAIKHNIVHTASPLRINIRDEDGYIEVSNNKQLRKQIETSNRQGLTQLQQLYSYLTKKHVLVVDRDTHFDVKLPLL